MSTVQCPESTGQKFTNKISIYLSFILAGIFRIQETVPDPTGSGSAKLVEKMHSLSFLLTVVYWLVPGMESVTSHTAEPFWASLQIARVAENSDPDPSFCCSDSDFKTCELQNNILMILCLGKIVIKFKRTRKQTFLKSICTNIYEFLYLSDDNFL